MTLPLRPQGVEQGGKRIEASIRSTVAGRCGQPAAVEFHPRCPRPTDKATALLTAKKS